MDRNRHLNSDDSDIEILDSPKKSSDDDCKMEESEEETSQESIPPEDMDFYDSLLRVDFDESTESSAPIASMGRRKRRKRFTIVESDSDSDANNVVVNPLASVGRRKPARQSGSHDSGDDHGERVRSSNFAREKKETLLRTNIEDRFDCSATDRPSDDGAEESESELRDLPRNEGKSDEILRPNEESEQRNSSIVDIFGRNSDRRMKNTVGSFEAEDDFDRSIFKFLSSENSADEDEPAPRSSIEKVRSNAGVVEERRRTDEELMHEVGAEEAKSSEDKPNRTLQLDDSTERSQDGISSSLVTSERRSKTLPAKSKILAIYPPTSTPGGISINVEDYMCLEAEQYLNDVIIDFYLKYLTEEVLSPEDRDRTYIFSSHFYTRLTNPVSTATDEEDGNAKTQAERRYAGVKRWTKNVNIFEKDFIVVPINLSCHWFLVIICFPYLVDYLEDEKLDFSTEENKRRRPCILVFDSLCTTKRESVTRILTSYLKYEYQTKMNKKKSFREDSLKVTVPRIPKQTNATDCGLYVIQYVEQFFKDPITDFDPPINLIKWFSHDTILQKRRVIAKLIQKLAANSPSGKDTNIPRIKLPDERSKSISKEDYDFEICSVDSSSPNVARTQFKKSDFFDSPWRYDLAAAHSILNKSPILTLNRKRHHSILKDSSNSLDAHSFPTRKRDFPFAQEPGTIKKSVHKHSAYNTKSRSHKMVEKVLERKVKDGFDKYVLPNKSAVKMKKEWKDFSTYFSPASTNDKFYCIALQNTDGIPTNMSYRQFKLKKKENSEESLLQS